MSQTRALDEKTQNELAKKLVSLHQPGNPVLMANVYDAATAKIIASNPNSRAVATASYAIAQTYGVDDDDMVKEQNLRSIGIIASVVLPTGKPLSVDLQAGYDDVEESIRDIIRLGAVGCNLEDVERDAKTGELKLRSLDDSVARVKAVKKAAADMGVPDFALNARTDTLVFGGTVDEAIARGKRFLDAGATTTFIWGSQRGVSKDEVKKLVVELDGMVNVKMNLREGFLNVQELKELGVARISVGPELFLRAMASYKEGVKSIFGE